MTKTCILHTVSAIGIYCQLPLRATCIKSVETDKMHRTFEVPQTGKTDGHARYSWLNWTEGLPVENQKQPGHKHKAEISSYLW